MFEGGGYGVGLTVSPLEPMPWDGAPTPPGVRVRPTRLGELMPVAARTPAELDAELERIAVVEGATTPTGVTRTTNRRGVDILRKHFDPWGHSSPRPDEDPPPF